MSAVSTPLLLDVPDRVRAGRLVLRALRGGDGPLFFDAVDESRESLYPFMPFSLHVKTVEDAERLARKTWVRFVERKEFRFAILRAGDHRFLGTCALHYADWDIPKFEIGCWVRTSQQRRGYATEATKALIGFGFDTLGAERLEIRFEHRNTASLHGAHKLGFTQEARLRCHNRAADGEIVDELVFALLRAEYEA